MISFELLQHQRRS